jgi:hypothetical protein
MKLTFRRIKADIGSIGAPHSAVSASLNRRFRVRDA